MILYSKNNQKFDTSDYEYFNHGNSANIFRSDDKALKIYFNGCRDYFRMKKATFKILKELNDSGIVKLDEYFYRSKNKLYQLGSIDAYTMEYISSQPFNFIDFEKKQFIELIRLLDKTIMNISNHGIALNDINKGNFVLTGDRLKIVDPEMFFKSSIRQRDYLYHANKTYILIQLTRIIRQEMNRTRTDGKIYPTVIVFNSDASSTLTEIIERSFEEDNLKEEYLLKLKRLS